jgi:uncharacterized protein (DUF2236 family)
MAVTTSGARSDDGYFPGGSSILRHVHEQRLVGLFYGQRALCIGALSPLNYVGTSEHSYAMATPFKRLVHTGNAFETIYFGTREDADKVLAYVDKLHRRVVGELGEDAGVTPSGTPYSALDPELMLWTMAVIADSAERFYELFVRPLSAAEHEALWQDYVSFAVLFGMPREAAPATYPEFRRWWEAKLAGAEMFLTDEARYVGYATAFEIPLPRLDQGAKRIHDLIMVGSLPERVRELYRLRYGRRDQLAFQVTTTAIRRARPLAPSRLTQGWNTGSFNRVAATERSRVASGRPTPQVLPDGPRPLPPGRYLRG